VDETRFTESPLKITTSSSKELNQKQLALVFAGGALGSALRYEISLGSPTLIWLIVVNLIGALVLGFIHTSKLFATDSAQSFWSTGFAGGFTTLSSLITATVFIPIGVTYVMAQIVIGLALYWAGRYLGRFGA
jgi:CrcB protein